MAGGANDFLFESHENVPVKRITPLKKSPITLLRIVSEKMMLKHGWPMMHEFQSFLSTTCDPDVRFLMHESVVFFGTLHA